MALAYHKCLDDVADDNSTKAKAARLALEGSYGKALERIPEECDAIRQSMDRIRLIESDAHSSPDAAANEFGSLLGELFAHYDDIWTKTLHDFGGYLGRFIYLMDAAVDLEQDIKTGSYNPFAKLDLNPDQMRAILANIIGEATIHFERLPLVQDANLMRSVLYSGVWLKFNQTYNNDEKSENKQS